MLLLIDCVGRALGPPRRGLARSATMIAVRSSLGFVISFFQKMMSDGSGERCKPRDENSDMAELSADFGRPRHSDFDRREYNWTVGPKSLIISSHAGVAELADAPA